MALLCKVGHCRRHGCRLLSLLQSSSTHACMLPLTMFKGSMHMHTAADIL